MLIRMLIHGGKVLFDQQNTIVIAVIIRKRH